MLKGLKEDEHSKVLWDKTLADAKKGWMSTPVPLSDDDVERFVLSPRFCIAQGRVSRRGPPRMRWGRFCACQVWTPRASRSSALSTTSQGRTSIAKRRRRKS